MKQAAYDLAHARPTTANRYGIITNHCAEVAGQALEAGEDPAQKIVEATVESLNRRYGTMGAVYDGDFWDFFSGKAPERALSVGTVLTIAAAGSEGSPDAVITNEKTLEKNGAGADCLRPRFSVLNPALTQSLPPYQTACGITDIMLRIYFGKGTVRQSQKPV